MTTGPVVSAKSWAAIALTKLGREAAAMEESGGNLAGEAAEVSPEPTMQSSELRKRRSTRIVQAVPLVVTGVDALGRPFTERTSSLIINCHGCRYQSKHYVLKNMWVTLEIPHPEAGHAPRSVRGRVAWIQRPRTVRQLFQVALELEAPGNIWGIAFPPDDWSTFEEKNASHSAPQVMAHSSAFPATHLVPPSTMAAREEASLSPATETETTHSEGEHIAASAADNIRVFPSQASATDVSLQVARQVARLLADAKAQLQNAAREAAAQAVAAEQRTAFEQWEQKFEAARSEVSNEAQRALGKIQEELAAHASAAEAKNRAAQEALQGEMPQWLEPKIAHLTREHAEKFSGAAAEEAAARARQADEQATQHAKAHAARNEEQQAQHAQRVSEAEEKLLRLVQQSQELIEHLKTHGAEIEAQISEKLSAAEKLAEATHRQQQESLNGERDSLNVTAQEIQDKVNAALEDSQKSWHAHLSSEIETAQMRWQKVMEGTFAAAQERAAGGLIEHGHALVGGLQEEISQHAARLRDAASATSAETEARLVELRATMQGDAQRLEEEITAHATKLKESAAAASAESEYRLAVARASLQEDAQRLEAAVTRAAELSEKLDGFAVRLEMAQQHALGEFNSQLDDVLSVHRNELHRRSESLFEELHGRLRSAFQAGSEVAATEFANTLEGLIQPHVEAADAMVQRLAGGRSLLDAAMTLQQDRIRNEADEAFAESMGRFRENLGTVEQILQDTAHGVTQRTASELEERAGELKHRTIEDLFKSAEWYEKKAQTQIQHVTEKNVEQAVNLLREKAGEVSAVFASELDHSSRSFVGHTQTQMEDVLREAFERAHGLFTEASETTVAAFTDQVQRTGREELQGFGEEIQQAMEHARTELENNGKELSQRVTAEQEEFLRNFQARMSGAVEAGVSDAHQRVQSSFAPLIDSWQAMLHSHQDELRGVYAKAGEHHSEEFRRKLENVSNQWMLATVSALHHQSQEVIAGLTAEAENRVRQSCMQVFAGVSETLRERLREIGENLSGDAERAMGKGAGSD